MKLKNVLLWGGIVLILLGAIVIIFYTTQPVLMQISLYGGSNDSSLGSISDSVSKILGKTVHFEGLAYVPEDMPINPPSAKANVVINNYPSAVRYRQEILEQVSSTQITIESPVVYFYNRLYLGIVYWFTYGTWGS
jgi:hypothetical protein